MMSLSLIGIHAIDNGWIAIYPHPADPDLMCKEFYPNTPEGIIDLLYCIKESALGHYNGKHSEYNIIIKKVKNGN